MTDREKAIVMAFTDCTMLVGDKEGIFFQYVQEKLGRSVTTHELVNHEVQDAIKEAARKDFFALAKADNGWISVKDRLPERYERILTYDKYSGVKENWLLRSNPCVSWSQGFHVTHWMPMPEPPEEEAT